MNKNLKSASKFLSLLLRHQPEKLALNMDDEGWVEIGELVANSASNNVSFTEQMIREIVATSDKQRFAIDRSGKRVRANQGHSIDVNLNLEVVDPPLVLYHGTADRNVESILHDGLIKQSRQHVHLSATIETAKNVGQRHGRPVIFSVDCERMKTGGFAFFKSKNGVWLVDHVPSEFLALM